MDLIGLAKGHEQFTSFETSDTQHQQTAGDSKYKRRIQHQKESAAVSGFNTHSTGRDGLTQSVHVCLQRCFCVMPSFSPSPTKNAQKPRVLRLPVSASGLLDRERLILPNTQHPVNQELPKSSHFKAKRHKGGEESESRNKKHRSYGFNPSVITAAYRSRALQCFGSTAEREGDEGTNPHRFQTVSFRI